MIKRHPGLRIFWRDVVLQEISEKDCTWMT